MPKDRLCPHCAAWLCRSDDAWCGYCGQGCAQLELTVTPAILHVGQQPPRLWCVLKNHSCAELFAIPTDTPEWLTFRSSFPLALRQSSEQTFEAEASPKPISAPEARSITFQTHAGIAASEVMWLEASPAVVCRPRRVEAWAGRSTNETTVQLVAGKGKLLVRSCRLRTRPGEVPGEAALLLQGKTGTPLAVSMEEGVRATLRLNAEKLPAGVRPAQLAVEYEGPHGPAYTVADLEIALRKPPELRWPRHLDRPRALRQTERQRLSFQFHNQSPDERDGGSENADLVLTSVELTPPPSTVMSIERTTPMPQIVRGGRGCEVSFELDLTDFEGKPVQQLDFKLKVHSNIDVVERVTCVSVGHSERYAGVVAIDFGTSNTCCAVLPPGGVPELLALDGGSPTSPTIVSYLDQSKTPPAIETGAKIKRISVDDETVAASTADHLKQRLGDRQQDISVRSRRTQQWGVRKASDAAADYLRSIRHTAESAKSAVFHHFVLTHPARCSLRQHARLRKALTEAFGSKHARISFLQEPIAALIPFMVERARSPEHKPYTVASFDLGGGTTDIAIVRVEYAERSANQVEIHPLILHCEGRRFGGEDLTNFLTEELRQRCVQFLEVREPGATLIAEGVEAVAALDVRRNRDTLNNAAERYKTSLSEEASAAAPAELDLRVTQPDGRAATYSFDFRVIAASVGDDLEGKFLTFARYKVEETASMLLDACERLDVTLDSIELSGKTAYLPVVHATMAKLFPGVTIHRAPDPKECVVKGACLSQALQRGSVLLRLPDQGQRLTSSLGVFGPDSPFFIPLLNVDDPVPGDGLIATLPGFWDGRESVELWENLNPTGRLIEYSAAAQFLDRLGEWVPSKIARLSEGVRWTLQLTLRNFELTVEATAPEGDVIAFRPAHGNGD